MKILPPFPLLFSRRGRGGIFAWFHDYPIPRLSEFTNYA
jgi:hypothetical protein